MHFYGIDKPQPKHSSAPREGRKREKIMNKGSKLANAFMALTLLAAVDAHAGGNRPMPPAGNDIDINNTARGGTGYGGKGGSAEQEQRQSQISNNAIGGNNNANNFSWRGAAITGAPGMAWLNVRNECGDAKNFSLGGGHPFYGSGGAGYGFINSSGVPVYFTGQELLEMTPEKRQDVFNKNGLWEGEVERAQCVITALKTLELDRQHQMNIAEKAHQHEVGMKMLEHNLNRKSNVPGQKTGASALEHANAHGYAAEVDPNYKKSMTSVVGAFTEVKKEKGDKVTPEDVLIKMFSAPPQTKKEPALPALTEWGDPTPTK